VAGAGSAVEERARQVCADLVRWNKNARSREEALRAQLAQPAGAASDGAERHRRELEAQRAEFDAYRRTADESAKAAQQREHDLRVSLTAATKRADNAGAKLSTSLEQAVKIAEKRAAATAQTREQELQELLSAATKRADEAETKLSNSLEKSVDVAQRRATYVAHQREKELQEAVQAATKRAEEAEARAAASTGGDVGSKRAAYLAAQREKELQDSLSSATARAMSAEARLARRESEFKELEKSAKARADAGEAGLPGPSGGAAGAGDGQEELRASLRLATERAEAAEARLASPGSPKEPASATRKREQKLQELVKATMARAEAAEAKLSELTQEVGSLAQQRERELQALVEAATDRAAAAEARLSESLREAAQGGGLCAGGPGPGAPAGLSLAQESSVAAGCFIKCGGSMALPVGGSSAGSDGMLLDVIRALASWSLLLLPADPCADDPKATAMIWSPWLLICWLLAFAYLVLWRLVCVVIVWPCSLALRARDPSPIDPSSSAAADPGGPQKAPATNGVARTNGTPSRQSPAKTQAAASPTKKPGSPAYKQAAASPAGPTCVHFSMVDDDDDDSAVPLVQQFSMADSGDAAFADARQQLTMVTKKDKSWIAPDKFQVEDKLHE